MNSSEIAKLANVSRSTVSRVINNYSNVPEETRRKVQKVIDEYGYVPNVSARALAGKSNQIIGLFIADINNTNSDERWIGVNSPYNMELLAEVIKSCKRRGYLVLVNTITTANESEIMTDHFNNNIICGGIFVGFPYHSIDIDNTIKNQHNIVLIDQYGDENIKSKDVKLINCDNITCGYEATKYLISLGHKNIAFIEGDNRLSAIERKKGYIQALEEEGIKVKNEFIIKGCYREDMAYKKTKNLLENDNRPTAIFAANDIMALGAIRSIEEIGLKVGDDISIIGVDHLRLTGWKERLTTMEFSIAELAEKSVSALLGEDGLNSKKCIPKLIEKSSCRRIKYN